MAGKAFRGLIAEPEFEIVAVRADQAHTAFDLGVAAPAKRVQQRSFAGTEPLPAVAGTLVDPSTLLR